MRGRESVANEGEIARRQRGCDCARAQATVTWRRRGVARAQVISSLHM